MICKNCGTQINDNQNFCISCGSPVEIEIQPEPVIDVQAAAPVKQRKPIKKSLFIISAILVVIIGVAAAILPSFLTYREMDAALHTVNSNYAENLYLSCNESRWKLKSYQRALSSFADELIDDFDAIDYDSIDYSVYENTSAWYDYCYELYGDMVYETPSNFSWLLERIADFDMQKYNELTGCINAKEMYFTGLYVMYNEQYYDEAIYFFAAIPETDITYELANEKIPVCIEYLTAETIEEVKFGIEIKDYEYAQDIVEYMATMADALAEELDSEGIDASNIDMSRIDTALNEALASEAAVYAEKAETEFFNNDINAAIGNMEVALTLQPDNTDYQTKMNEYMSYVPFNLFEEGNVFQEIEYGDFYGVLKYGKAETSNVGEDEINCIIWYNNKIVDDSSLAASYLLKGNYDYVTGKIFLVSDYRDTNDIGYFEAYGDGKLLYTSEVMTGGKEPSEFEFDCSGVYELEIRVHSTYDDGWTSTRFGISNMVAQKNLPQ